MNNMKSSVITAVESKLHEMKTTLASAFDNRKTYAEVFHKPSMIIASSCTNEGYFNNTTDTTSDANFSQTIKKTLYPSANSTTITKMERPSPKHISLHVTDRDENMRERNTRKTQNRHRHLNINRNPAPSSVVVSKKQDIANR